MQIFSSIHEISRLQNAVVAIGSFDGMHLGHQQIFKCLKENAARLNGTSVVITFEPHPQEVLYRNSDFFRINKKEEKIKLIEKEDIDYLIILPFTRELAQISFKEFIQNILIDKIGMKAFIMGPNHSIGKNREGTIENISTYVAENDIEIIKVSEYLIHNSSIRSQKIRELLKNGDLEKASLLLGYDIK
jgi:riboflavin kinase/FMN adenylyltransferase